MFLQTVLHEEELVVKGSKEDQILVDLMDPMSWMSSY
jgi:hypothetical protein